MARTNHEVTNLAGITTMIPKSSISQQEEQAIEERIESHIIERDTRNILLGAFMSMLSSITTLYIVNAYLIPKTTAAAVSRYRGQSLSMWEPLSAGQLYHIQHTIENYKY